MKKFNAENMSPATMAILHKATRTAAIEAGTKHERLYLEGLIEELETGYEAYGSLKDTVAEPSAKETAPKAKG